MGDSVVHRIQAIVGAALPSEDRSLIAVSGGIDSMVLLHAARAVRPSHQLVVATFDHASGPHTAVAVDLAQRIALGSGISVTIGRAEPSRRPSEATWRDARLAFLRAVAFEHRAVICTAHTRDDQVETVLFRELRGAGARGLAGLAAASDIRRPLLGCSRSEVMDYTSAAGVEWVDDPTNLDRAYTRNRLRHELIPALRAARPSIEADLVDIGHRAARWREDLDRAIDERITFDLHRNNATGERFMEVARESLAGYSDDALGIIWPALLGRLGVAADRRGTRRLVAFTTEGATGQRIQLSGGWTVYRRRQAFEVRLADPTEP